MADATTVVEGKVKYREGKKWKSRWCVLKKPSPVADRLQLILYKDVHEALRAGGKVKTSFPLDGYLGLESGFSLERETNVLAIVCLKNVALLAFETREYLIQFEVKIRRSLGQEHQFPVKPVKVPSGSRLPLDSVKLLIHGSLFCITSYVPPRILQCWNVADLRRFGAVDGKFCFEGGSRCGKGTGVHAVQTDQADEIAEILHRSSLGKSAAARAINNRSSQFLDYSLAAPDPFWIPNHHQPGGGTGPGAGAGTNSSIGGEDRSPAMLACCQGLPAAGEADEWGCRKRHSVSVTEFHRASAATFQEKLRLMSTESQERQRLMAIYDVPPKHPRKLEVVSGTSSISSQRSKEESSTDSGGVAGPASEQGFHQSHLAVRLDPHSSANRVDLASSQGSRRVEVTTIAGREYCVPRSLNTSVFDSIVKAQVDTTKRNEALQSLQKQESHLHQEIVLLDQMLQSCYPGDDKEQPPLPPGGLGGPGGRDESSAEGMEPWQDKISTLEPPLKCSTPLHVAQKAASLPPKISSSKKDLDFPVNKPGTFPSASDHSVSGVKEKEGMGDSSPLSPNLLSKLESIPVDSHLNAPLPYVNLAKYDADPNNGSTHGFVHLQGTGDSGCVVVAPGLLRNPAGGSLASLRNRSAVNSMPSRCFSETHIGPNTRSVEGSLAPQKPLPLPPEGQGTLESIKHASSADTLLEDDNLMPPTTYAPPVPYPRPLVTVCSTVASADPGSPQHALSLPVVSAPVPAVAVPIREPIYANEPPPLPPPRCKRDTPPPELPPKGPALMRRSKLRSSGGSGSCISNTVPPVPPVRTRSLSVGSQGKFYDYDNQPGLDSPTVVPPEARRGVAADENYLPMGSPKMQPRREIVNEPDGSRPSSVYATNSPKTRGRNALPASRGNADVLSGYMDMANMFVDEPKFDADEDCCDGRELYISEPILDAGEGAISADSNYMEMSSMPCSATVPSAKRKSVVLKNLEALQTYVSTTPAGEATPKSPPTSSTPPPSLPSRSDSPSTPRRSSSLTSTPVRSSLVYTPGSSPIRSMSATPDVPLPGEREGCKVYSRSSSLGGNGKAAASPSKGVKRRSSGGFRDKHRPAIPFTNLKNFEQKQIKSSYVNTYIPAPEVPLPEPPKKEEGFFARLIRRNSKDKTASQSQENLNVQKNRTSIFERSMSEQSEAVVDEKANSKLKVGRRRSASFPNRLSFQETAGAAPNSPSKKDTPPPLPPSLKSSSSVRSTSSKSSSSSIKYSTKQECRSSSSRQDNRSDNSSVHDLSDDSDMAPLLQRGGGSKSEMRVLTVLHVQQDLTVNPMASLCASLSPGSSSELLQSKGSSSFSLSKHSSSSISMSDSSKTDDEKLFELLEGSKRQSVLSDVDDVKSKLSLPLGDEKQLSVSTPKDEAAAIARHLATVPPLIPPKTKRLPLSPVSEASSPDSGAGAGAGVVSMSTPSLSPSSPPSHPHAVCAPNQDEAIYVDMKELLPHPPRGPASPSAASLHPYNCPREQKQRARATLRITPALEDEEGNIWVPRQDAGEGRPPQLPSFSSPSPRIPPSFCRRGPSSLEGQGAGRFRGMELRYTTPLVVNVEPLDGAGEGLAEQLSLSSHGSCQSLRSFDDSVIRSSPAATVLRPRSGRDYQVVERRRVGSDSMSSSSATHSPSCSTVFTYEQCSLAHKSPATLSLSSWQSREPSPGRIVLTQPSTPQSVSRERTPSTPPSAPPLSSYVSLSLSKEASDSPDLGVSSRSNKDSNDPPLPLPPRKFRMCRRAQSEPCSSRTESHRGGGSVRSSPPTSPLSLAPELLEPMLNYAEIDLTVPPPVETAKPASFLRRHRKGPSKPVVIEYTQIDYEATTALKRAGQEHALYREDNNSLRRGASAALSLPRKNSTPVVVKDRKGSASFFRDRERKLSTCSMESV